MAHVLLCGSCGGPLPLPIEGNRYVKCRFCGATSDLETGELKPEELPETYVPIGERFPSEIAAFKKALAEPVAGGEPTLSAFRSAAEALSTMTHPEMLTNIAFGIALRFFETRGVDVTRNAEAMEQIALRYLECQSAMAWFRAQHPRQQGSGNGLIVDSTESDSIGINLKNLPTSTGKRVDFAVTMTMDELQELADTPPVLPPREVAPPQPAVPAKRSWWKKLFG